MKAVISTTYDNNYLFFLPLVTWCWNKIGVDVICFMPYSDYTGSEAKNQVPAQIIRDTLAKYNLRCELHYFNAPEHKKATYAQCSRLYAACLDLPENEILIIGDVDMALFKLPDYIGNHNTFSFNKIRDEWESGKSSEVFSIFGYDLVPDNQYPMCYISAPVKQWRRAIDATKTYQQHLDLLLGDLEAQHFRGNFWGKDQETAFQLLKDAGTKALLNRAREGTQFASKRYDRDDAYILDRLNPDTIDFHMNRPGYEEKNFEIILTILKYHYPDENFDWLVKYTEEYRKLL